MVRAIKVRKENIMKKNTLFFVCLLILAMVVSCKKENVDENILQARMTDFHTSKAYIDGANYSCFLNGEEILVNNENCTITPKQQDNNRSCDITNVTKADEYYAFYPSSLLAQNATISGGFNNVQVTLPQIQTFEYDNTLNKQIISNPMAGYLNASSGTILLQNLCALLKVTVYSTTNSTLRSIDVTLKGTTIWGTGAVYQNDWSLVMDNTQQEEGDHSTVTLSFGSTGRQGNPNGESFYIVVPKATIGTDNTNSVKVIIHGDYIANNLSVTTRTFQMGLSSNNDENIIPKNTITPLPKFSIGCHPTYYNNHPNCVFTVNDQGKKVTFAPGNLVHHEITNGLWHFPNMPYHPIPIPTYLYYFTYNSNLIGNNASNDWGWINEVEGNPIHTWRIPTKAEWVYVLTGARRAKRNCYYCRVENRNGLIIYPDGCNLESPSTHTANITENTWVNTYERAGCIFLPAHHSTCVNTGDFVTQPTTKSNPGTHEDGAVDGYYAMADAYTLSSDYRPGHNIPTGYKCFRFIALLDNNNAALNCDCVIPNVGVNVRLVHDLPQY